VIAAYALPAAAIWMLLGLVLGALPVGPLSVSPVSVSPVSVSPVSVSPVSVSTVSVSTVALVLLICYAGGYGLAELAGPGPGTRLPAPGTRWQVPQSLVAQAPRRRRLLIWGALLGPGFATRNPYPGFAMLPLAVAAAGSLTAAVALGAAVGTVHGTARGLALLRDARDLRAGTAAGHLAHLLKSLYWRRLDGIALLLTGGAAVAAVLPRL
jgi:hypothetical protein